MPKSRDPWTNGWQTGFLTGLQVGLIMGAAGLMVLVALVDSCRP